jgi:hypothetical protein
MVAGRQEPSNYVTYIQTLRQMRILRWQVASQTQVPDKPGKWEAALQAVKLGDLKKDGWGSPYRVKEDSEDPYGFVVMSNGTDKIPDSPDDIAFTSELEGQMAYLPQPSILIPFHLLCLALLGLLTTLLCLSISIWPSPTAK